MTELGIPEYEAKQFESRFRKGASLLSVHCDDRERVKTTQEILAQTGTGDVFATTRRKQISPPAIGDVPHDCGSGWQTYKRIDSIIAASVISFGAGIRRRCSRGQSRDLLTAPSGQGRTEHSHVLRLPCGALAQGWNEHCGNRRRIFVALLLPGSNVGDHVGCGAGGAWDWLHLAYAVGDSLHQIVVAHRLNVSGL